jgi:hypothetical protein
VTKKAEKKFYNIDSRSKNLWPEKKIRGGVNSCSKWGENPPSPSPLFFSPKISLPEGLSGYSKTSYDQYFNGGALNKRS